MREGNILKLRYCDNGKGFNTQATTISGGMGLSNITSRINSLNGTLKLTSNEGKGMRAAIDINTKPEDKKINQRKRRWKKR